MSGMTGAVDGEKNVPLSVAFESSLNGETRTIAEDLVIPKVDQVGPHAYSVVLKRISENYFCFRP